MENLKKVIVLILAAAVVSSCLFDKRPKDVDPFYTTRNFGQFPVMPLVKPIKLIQNDQSKEWGIDIPHSFKKRLSIENINEIGVCEIYVYGRIDKKKWNISTYKKGDFVYAHKYGGTTISKEAWNSAEEIRIYPIDSNSKTFILPERWFVINVADSTTEAFFSKTKYDEYLKEKEISGKMYNIDKYHKQFIETGILPWFPDSIKVKLKQ